MAPTIRLLNQTEQLLQNTLAEKKSLRSVHLIHSESNTGDGYGAAREALLTINEQPTGLGRVVFLTTATFIRILSSINAPSRWCLILDEAFEQCCLEEGWRDKANAIAPTLVGGSKKHGGPDLGPTRAKKAWATLGVDGMGIWDAPPPKDFIGMPRLTPRMAARIQGFPDEWQFFGRKTAAYRQIGNAFPPPVAAAVARQIYAALSTRRSFKVA